MIYRSAMVLEWIAPEGGDAKLDVDTRKARIAPANLIENIDRVGSCRRNRPAHAAGVIHQEHHIGLTVISCQRNSRRQSKQNKRNSYPVKRLGRPCE
jgi:hypothetical protein